MPSRPPELPDFLRPPVSEVVLSLQFGSLANLRSAHIGFLWAKIRDRYPTVTEHPPLDPAFETFGSLSTPQPEIRFQPLLRLPFPRYWFESEDEHDLCQIQQDRLVHNWRKRTDGSTYPRYEHIKAELLADLDAFEEFLKAEKLGPLSFNQTEISYINTIDLPDGDDPHGALARVMSVWSDIETTTGELEDVFFRARYVLSKESNPYARLHVSVAPMLRTTTLAKVIQLELTFRGKPEDDGRPSALALMDDGRATIVKAFAELTTPTMHTHWGRTDVPK